MGFTVNLTTGTAVQKAMPERGYRSRMLGADLGYDT